MWESLSARIDAVETPLVLAGPMLRKVTPNSVTVWLALRQRADVTLEIRTNHVLTDAPLLSATEATYAFTGRSPDLAEETGIDIRIAA